MKRWGLGGEAGPWWRGCARGVSLSLLHTRALAGDRHLRPARHPAPSLPGGHWRLSSPRCGVTWLQSKAPELKPANQSEPTSSAVFRGLPFRARQRGRGQPELASPCQRRHGDGLESEGRRRLAFPLAKRVELRPEPIGWRLRTAAGAGAGAGGQLLASAPAGGCRVTPSAPGWMFCPN